MTAIIYVDRAMAESDRRASLYRGDYHLLTNRQESLDLIAWARTLIDEAFGDIDPQRAHLVLDVKDFIQRASRLKSLFTNHQHTKELCQRLILAMGVDPEETYWDLPRLRAVPSGDYLTSGVSYAYKPHRDTWYAHPPTLINYWVPVYDVTDANVMSFWPAYWDRPVGNSGFDYDHWVAEARFTAANHVGADTRPHPLPNAPIDNASELRIALNAGDITMFSTCQLHATAPNTSGLVRFSYDLRTLNLPDYLAGRGPRDLDGHAAGTTLGDFLRVSDLEPLVLPSHQAARATGAIAQALAQ
jgi:hypothetical protein